jgi:cobalt/nickel transport system permease protein
VSAIDYGARLASEAPRPPLIRRLDPRLRLSACLAFTLAMVSFSTLAPLVLGLALAVTAAVLARLEPWPTVKRMVSVDSFMIFVIGFLPFTIAGEPAFTLLGQIASQEGLHRAAVILLASNAVVLAILALIGTMEEPELGSGLAGLRIPAKLTHLLLLTMRYIDVLRREYRRLRISMKVRGFRMGCNRHSWTMIGYLFGMLLVRSIERSERILIAMRCRGYRGELPSLDAAGRIGPMDLAFGVLSFSALVALVLLDRA